MSKINWYCSLVAVCVILLSPVVWGDYIETQDLTSSANTKFSLRAYGMAVTVVAKTKVVNAKDFLGPRFIEGQFTDTFSVIENLEIVVNNRKLVVPSSAFIDLVDVRKCELILSAGQGVLHIYGGDGSESFEGEIYFDKVAVRRRAVFDPASPKKPMEETIYSLRVIE